MKALITPCSVVLAGAVLAACHTVPGTGRTQLRFLSTEQEMALGDDAYQEALADAKIIRSGPDYEMVQRIGTRVAAAAARLYPDPARQFQWEFNLVDEPKTVNAWALPGGKSAVYTGLLPVTGDEASLAVVMGHEVAHAVAHHGAERISQSGLFSGLLMGADLALSSGKVSSEQRTAIMTGLGVGGNVGVMLPFSRAHESEADELGLYIAARAGYDPQAAIGLWERMEQAGGAGPPEFLSTHPSESTRIERLRKAMPKAMRFYRQARKEQGR